MKVEKKELKPDMKIAGEFLDLKAIDAGIILSHLDEQIKLREMPIEKRLRK